MKLIPTSLLLFAILVCNVAVTSAADITVMTEDPPMDVSVNQEIQIMDDISWDLRGPTFNGDHLPEGICDGIFRWSVVDGPSSGYTITSADETAYHFQTTSGSNVSILPLSIVFHTPGTYIMRLEYIDDGVILCNFDVQASTFSDEVVVNAVVRVPTMSEWGLIILSLLILIFGALGIRQNATNELGGWRV